MKKIIGLSGVAGCGKDTMYALLSARNPNVKRFALADSLKQEIAPLLKDLYGIDIFTCSREDKNLVRQILVEHGKIRRIATNGTYWTNKLTQDILDYVNAAPENIAVITDIRYSVYEEDEIFWLKNKMGGHLVHIAMMLNKGEKLQPPNKDEAENDPIVRKSSDLRIIWPRIQPFSFKNLNLLNYAEKVEKFITE